METVTFNNKIEFPILGTGTNTYGKENNQYQGKINGNFQALESAIELGYRLIDTAISYRNEAGVGETVAKSGVPREEFYLTTKIPPTEEYIKDKETVKATVEKSLKNLRTDYIDLYLIHQPIEDEEQLKLTWQVLEEFVENGKLRSIGVSNFSVEDLKKLNKFAVIKPAVNQIQSNPTNWNDETIEFMLDEGITPQAWGPMKTSAEQKEKVKNISDKYGKSWGQVLLRYQIQRGVIVIPKSHNSKNQQANLDIFDFDLTAEDIMKMSIL